MTEHEGFAAFFLMVIVSVFLAYVLGCILFPSKCKRVARLLMTSALATVFAHLYLWLFGGGMDALLPISILAMFVYGLTGAGIIEFARTVLSRWHPWIWRSDD